MPALLEVRNLRTTFVLPKRGMLDRERSVHAVDDVSFALERNEILGLVGESGSGKSTLGRSILRALEPTAGSVVFEGTDVTHLSSRGLRPFRRRMQLVFQDPTSSLNPRLTVEQMVGEPLFIHRLERSRAARRERVAKLLETVGLAPDAMPRYAHEFSGGQRQRIGIARALASEPVLLVADEPVSALDVSIQAQIVKLLADLRARLGLAMIIIAHDIALLEHIADRIAVMYLGRIVELAPSRILCGHPRHPYTEALLAAVPVPDPRARRRHVPLSGEMPSPIDLPSGCAFRTRCRYAIAACATTQPELRTIDPGHASACIRDDILEESPTSEARAATSPG